MSAKGSSLWHSSLDYGTVATFIGDNRRLTLEQDEFCFLIRRGQVVSANPHGLDFHKMGTCGNVMRNGAVCGERVCMRLQHSETLCRKIRGGRKHAAVQDGVTGTALEVGMGTTMTGLSDEDGNRVDFLISGMGQFPVGVDVCNVDELSKPLTSRLWQGGGTSIWDVQTPLVAAENRKNVHYKAASEEAGVEFLPFVTGAYGAFAPGAMAVLGRLATRVQEVELISYAEALRRVQRRVQARVMKQIARAGLSFILRYRSRREKEDRDGLQVKFQVLRAQLTGAAQERSVALALSMMGSAGAGD